MPTIPHPAAPHPAAPHPPGTAPRPPAPHPPTSTILHPAAPHPPGNASNAPHPPIAPGATADAPATPDPRQSDNQALPLIASLLPADDRVTRLTLLDCGTFHVPAAPPAGPRTIGIPAYLIETRSGARILVDGGFPPAYAADPAAAAMADGLAAFGYLLDHGPHQSLPGQLALLGLTLADITLHILTHGHIDHVGALPLITCPLILTKAERASPRPSYFRDRRPINWPDVETCRIAAETTLCAGLTLIPTPGHTPGHLSLLLTLPQTGPVILAADAINRACEPDEGYAGDPDPKAAMTSARTLLALQAATGALLIFGHDPAQWPTLRKAPDSYT